MKLVQVKDLNQSYSFLQMERPETAWAIPVSGIHRPEAVHGIPQAMLEQATEFTTKWTGWAFDEHRAWLLFESKEDAIFAKIHFGEAEYEY